MKYTTPDLEGNAVAYRGRRYWVIELKEGGEFQCIDTTIADYVVFDRFDEAPIGRIRREPGGGFEISTTMGFEGPDQAPTLREAVQVAVKLINQECKALS